VLDSFKQDTFSHGTRKKTKKELEKEEEERKRKEEEVLVLETFDHAPVVLRSVKGVGDRNDFLIPYYVFTRIIALLQRLTRSSRIGLVRTIHRLYPEVEPAQIEAEHTEEEI
jgi:hypothetical protein